MKETCGALRAKHFKHEYKQKTRVIGDIKHTCEKSTSPCIFSSSYQFFCVCAPEVLDVSLRLLYDAGYGSKIFLCTRFEGKSSIH